MALGTELTQEQKDALVSKTKAKVAAETNRNTVGNSLAAIGVNSAQALNRLGQGALNLALPDAITPDITIQWLENKAADYASTNPGASGFGQALPTIAANVGAAAATGGTSLLGTIALDAGLNAGLSAVDVAGYNDSSAEDILIAAGTGGLVGAGASLGAAGLGAAVKGGARFAVKMYGKMVGKELAAAGEGAAKSGFQGSRSLIEEESKLAAWKDHLLNSGLDEEQVTRDLTKRYRESPFEAERTAAHEKTFDSLQDQIKSGKDIVPSFAEELKKHIPEGAKKSIDNLFKKPGEVSAQEEIENTIKQGLSNGRSLDDILRGPAMASAIERSAFKYSSILENARIISGDIRLTNTLSSDVKATLEEAKSVKSDILKTKADIESIKARPEDYDSSALSQAKKQLSELKYKKADLDDAVREAKSQPQPKFYDENSKVVKPDVVYNKITNYVDGIKSLSDGKVYSVSANGDIIPNFSNWQTSAAQREIGKLASSGDEIFNILKNSKNVSKEQMEQFAHTQTIVKRLNDEVESTTAQSIAERFKSNVEKPQPEIVKPDSPAWKNKVKEIVAKKAEDFISDIPKRVGGAIGGVVGGFPGYLIGQAAGGIGSSVVKTAGKVLAETIESGALTLDQLSQFAIQGSRKTISPALAGLEQKQQSEQLSFYDKKKAIIDQLHDKVSPDKLYDTVNLLNKQQDYLDSVKPQQQSAGALNPGIIHQPTPVEQHQYQKVEKVVYNPYAILTDLNKNKATPEQVKAIKEVFPQTFDKMRIAALDGLKQADQNGVAVPLWKKQQLDLLLDLDGAGSNIYSSKFVFAYQQVKQEQAQNQPKPRALPPSFKGSASSESPSDKFFKI